MIQTQMEAAQQGKLTPAMEQVAATGKVPMALMMGELAAGRAVLPWNPRHAPTRAMLVGSAFRTGVNANLGGSGVIDHAAETSKLNVALEAGADCVMDLSVGPDVVASRVALLSRCPVPLGTVPIYEAVEADGDSVTFTPEKLLATIETQAREGVDFMTLHAGLLRDHLPLVCRRKMGIVSRGGAIMAEWMQQYEQENPIYTNWDRVLEVCHEYDVTVSLGDGLRPGCLADAGDDSQYAELRVLGDLVRRSRAAGVQVMVEGPGHVPLDQIAEQMRMETELCEGAPFYVLGPVVTDVAAGYDHIAAAIGAAQAAVNGAALLCYVTPAEHLGLPSAEDVRQGVLAFRIAAHAADVARKVPGARDVDDAMADARMDFDWERQFELALDGEHARRRFEQSAQTESDRNKKQNQYCSMCGEAYCAVRRMKRIHEKTTA